MKRSFYLALAALVLASCSSDKATQKKDLVKSSVEQGMKYPEARRQDVTDVYHGVTVADPYRWLEDPDSEETRQWIEAQNKITFGWLEQIEARGRIQKRLTKLWDYERYSIPTKKGGRYFYTYNPGLLNQAQLYTLKNLEDKPQLLLDPNKLSADGTTALTGGAISHDGKYFAYAISKAGSDWKEWRVRDIETGKDLEDQIQWSKFANASWTVDNKGFFYSAYDPPEDKSAYTGSNYYQKLYYHKLGTPQDQDRLVYQRKDQKEWGFDGRVTDDGRYLIIHVWHGTDPKNGFFYQDLKAKKPTTVELLKNFDALYHYVGNNGTTFWFRTDHQAPRSRLIEINLRQPQPDKWREVIPQTAETLEEVNLVGGHFIAEYLKDAKSQVTVFDKKGKTVRQVDLTGIGSAAGFAGKDEDSETFYSFTGFTTPTTIYRYDMATGKSTLFRQPKVDFDPSGYETKQIFYSSKDGTRVPMFITHKKGLDLDGNRPTYLYGYGGFNISLPPSFRVSNMVWLEMGGVYAVANLRGGNEYGEQWHQGGVKLNKQNVFDDFIAASQWLIDNKYTSSKRLAIGGGSNGGLLVGACITQRPELFAAAVPAVGVLDMLRYHTWTIGHAWSSDYGTVDDPEEFKALYAYSPYHNLKPQTAYPATLITTADHDDRVVPAHSFKFAAALQHAHNGTAPTLIRIETKAGHGAGKPVTKIIEETADRWAFLVRALDVDTEVDSATKASKE